MRRTSRALAIPLRRPPGGGTAGGRAMVRRGSGGAVRRDWDIRASFWMRNALGLSGFSYRSAAAMFSTSGTSLFFERYCSTWISWQGLVVVVLVQRSDGMGRVGRSRVYAMPRFSTALGWQSLTSTSGSIRGFAALPVIVSQNSTKVTLRSPPSA